MSRSIDLSIEVPGTPEEVWQAIATAEGMSSWFMPVPAISPRDEIVSVWEPPHRVVFDAPVMRGSVLAQEWTISPVDGGGSCVVRLVQSGFGAGEEWDDDYNGMTGGWGIFLESLRLHLSRFRGRSATCVIPMASVPGTSERAWSELCAALGISASLGAGDRLSVESGPGLHGVVESVTLTGAVHTYLFALDDGLGTGFVACEGRGDNGDNVTICLYLYLYGPDAAAFGAAWTAWFEESFRSQVSAAQ